MRTGITVFVAICASVLIGCDAPERPEKSVQEQTGTYAAGWKCGDSGAEIDECAVVCDRMGGSKSVCWNGYFDSIRQPLPPPPEPE